MGRAQDPKNIIVIYHRDCIDGVAAAWAVEKKWGREAGTLNYIPYGHHDGEAAERSILAALGTGSTIFFVDVAPTPAFLKKLLAADPVSIRILDHHKSAFDSLRGITGPNLDVRIDPLHPSAAHMVWNDLHPGKPPPDFFDLIAKMDVAEKLETEDDYAAAAFIDSKGIRGIREAFGNFASIEEMTYAALVENGREIYSDQYNRILKLEDNVMVTQIDLPHLRGKRIPIVNADVQNFGRAVSKYLKGLGKEAGCGIAFAWYVQGNGAVTMSIRSDGTVDASILAKLLCKACGAKGGGHATSAAIHFASLQEFTRLIPLLPRKACT